MKIVGYGICGPGEAARYMAATLDEFKRLCDTTIILCNNTTAAEEAMIASYGFAMVHDDREWGINQWRIKEDFVKYRVSKLVTAGDMLVCLDMDEVFDTHLTRQWLLDAPLDAYHVFIVDLWNDGYKPESCFWNVRLWKWNGDYAWEQKPVHCGLAPRWAYKYHKFAPFILKHYGLKEKGDRDRKVARYEKYDPTAKYLSDTFYKMLKSDTCKPFDEEALHNTIAEEVRTYQQPTAPKKVNQTANMGNKKNRYAYVKNPHGNVLDIPERQLDETLKRPGFTFIMWVEEAKIDLEELFLESASLKKPDEMWYAKDDTKHPLIVDDVSLPALEPPVEQIVSEEDKEVPVVKLKKVKDRFTPEEAIGGIKCSLCGKLCKDKQGLTLHIVQKHGKCNM